MWEAYRSTTVSCLRVWEAYRSTTVSCLRVWKAYRSTTVSCLRVWEAYRITTVHLTSKVVKKGNLFVLNMTIRINQLYPLLPLRRDVEILRPHCIFFVFLAIKTLICQSKNNTDCNSTNSYFSI